ncbi:MAG: SDR family NAD(P)-dependent oxidoreductase [Candidatus Sumerlaeia bacterium]|nr:SDR family NAD(P)-dependent oxidoreductase [Candidatus Sumerlaeia bacterium]
MSNDSTLVAVTGAGGFIGSHLVEALLRSGRRVRALVRYNGRGQRGLLEESERKLPAELLANLEVVAGDVTDPRCVRALVKDCQTVFHLAALIGIPYSYEAPHSYVETNIRGTLNMLEACHDLGVPHFIHTSTSEVYGTARTTPMDESHPLQAQSPYAATKIAADKLVESWAASFGLPMTIVRPFNAYGPRQSLRAVIPTIVVQALHKKCEKISLGALDPVRDLTFVEDVARAFLVVADAAPAAVRGKTYNLGTGQGISIGNLVVLAQEVLGTAKEVETEDERLRPALSEVRTLISNNSFIRHDIGWKPEITLQEGIKRTAEYFKTRLDRVNPEEYAR